MPQSKTNNVPSPCSADGKQYVPYLPSSGVKAAFWETGLESKLDSTFPERGHTKCGRDVDILLSGQHRQRNAAHDGNLPGLLMVNSCSILTYHHTVCGL